MLPPSPSPRHIRLTSHAGGTGAPAIRWAAASPAERGPVVGTTSSRAHRNVIGTHSGAYSVYRALAVAAGTPSAGHRADLTDTAPTHAIGPYPQDGRRLLHARSHSRCRAPEGHARQGTGMNGRAATVTLRRAPWRVVR